MQTPLSFKTHELLLLFNIVSIYKILYGTGSTMIPKTQITTANVLFYINCNGECQDIYERYL